MKTRSLLLASIAVTGLLTGCGTYPLGVPLGLTRAEINALPPAKRTAVLKAYQQAEARDQRLSLIGGQADLASWRQTTSRDVIALESLNRGIDYRDTSPGAVK
jgi:hypothetical protein